MFRTMLLSGTAALALALAGPAFAAGESATSGQGQSDTQMQQTGTSGSQAGAAGSGKTQSGEASSAAQSGSGTETWRDSDAQAGSTKVRPIDRNEATADMGEASKAARDDAQVGGTSELAGERYSDLEGRQVYSREGSEIGSVQGATTDERGEIDGFIVAGGPALGPHLLLIPVDVVRPAQGSSEDLEADVGDKDLERSMQEWEKSGQGSKSGQKGSSQTQ